MAENDIVIRVSLDDQGAVRGIQQIGKEIEGLDRPIAQAGQSGQALGVALGTALGNIAFAAVSKLSSALISLPGQLIELAAHGSDVDDVAAAFERLTEKAGATSEAFANELREATANTITDFELFKKANESLRAGIKPDEMIELTKAARALAEETGQNLTQSIDEVTSAFTTGRVQALQNRLGIIDVEKAQNELAKTLGVTRAELSKEAEVLAARNAILDASKRKTEETGQVSIDFADAVNQVFTALGNARDRIAQAIAQNENLSRGMQALAQLIRDLPWEFFINGILGATQVIADLANEISTNVTYQFNNFKKALQEVQEQFNLFNNGLTVVGKVAKQVGNLEVPSLSKAIQETAKELQSATKAQEAIQKATSATQKTIKEGTKAVAGNRDAWIDQTKAAEIARKAAEEQKKKFDELDKSIDEQLKKLKELASPRGLLSVRDAFIDTATASNEWGQSSSELQADLQRLREEYIKLGLSADAVDEAIGKAAQKMQEEASKGAQQLSAELSNAISSIGTALSSILLDGADFESALQSLGGSLGRDAGSMLGEYLGGPLGEAVGAEIGAIAGEAIIKGLFDVFGNKDNAGTKFRKEADAFFADIFDKDRLQVVINDQLKQITDLEFSGTNFGNAELGFFDAFNNLPDAARAGFDGVARAFTELLGKGQEFASGLAAVFANNLGGSLNNLQLLIQTTGQSAEQLKDSIVEAFLDGKVSALEAQTAINGINQAMQKGIPDAVGAVTQAFDNLKAAGVSGGRASTDALRDIADEAKELGIKTLPEIIDYLVSTGQYSADEIQKVFDALKAAGIESIDQLSTATDQQLLAVLAQLQATDFPFAKAAEEAQMLIDKVQELPEEIRTRLVFDVQVNASESDKQVLNKAKAPNGSVGQSMGLGA